MATAPRHWDRGGIRQLDRAAQVTIFRLRTGHCQLLSHLHRLKIPHSDECPCGTGPQTPNHILQSCPTFDDLRRQTWPSPEEAHRLLLFVGCLTSQQQASVSQGRICSDNFTCCHTEIEVADQTFYLTQSQYTDTGPTSPSADPITSGSWQGSHWNANF